jgi:N-acetylglucosaminyldiphosphoundecaprenol N-acetyl-beta-D-mannosaminyltransferase
MQNRINILNTPIDNLTMEETLQRIGESIDKNQRIHHVVVNAAKIVNMQKDGELYDSVVGADIINADGQAVVWASKLLGQPLKERVAGIDLMDNLVSFAHKNSYKIFFLGAKPSVVQSVVEKYKNMFSEDIIAGYRDGYFSKDEERSVAEEIANSNPDILFVAISSPTKEIFLNKYKDEIKAPFIMGVGGSFDVVAGIVNRAPIWMQKSGLEWFYRFIQEPRRMWRRAFITNFQFIILVVKEILTKLLRRENG